MKFIEQQLRRASEQHAATGDDWCVTLESKKDSDHWIQFTWTHLNMHYPYQADPARQLAVLYPQRAALTLESWQANMYVTFALPREIPVDEVTAFVERFIESVLNERTESDAWSVKEESL